MDRLVGGLGADFGRLWAGESASLLGREVTALAIPLVAVTVLDASPWEAGLLNAVGHLPYLLLGVPAGLVVDRRPRRPLLIVAALVQAGALTVVPVLAVLGRLSLPVMVGVALIAGSAHMLREVAYRSYVPRLVAPGRLTDANARLTLSESVAAVGGPGLGGILVGAIGAPLAVLVNVVGLIISAASLGRIRRPEPRSATDHECGWRRLAAEGLRLAYRSPMLRASAGEAATYNFFWQWVMALLVIYAVRELELTAAVLGLLLATGAAGAAVGALLAVPLARRFGLGATVLAGAVLADVAPLALPLAPQGQVALVFLAPAFFLQGIGMTACNVHVFALRQLLTPDALLGRVNAWYQTLTHGVIPVGALLGGASGELLGPRAGIAIGCVGLLTTWLWFWFSPVRGLRDTPAAATKAPAAVMVPS